MRRSADTFADIMDAFYRVGRDGQRRNDAIRLSGAEFKLAASFKGFAFTTTIQRSRRLAHVVQECYSVWVPSGNGTHRLVRVVARGFCGQWIISARRVEWATIAEGSRCEQCLTVALRVVEEQAQGELADAADGAAAEAVNS